MIPTTIEVGGRQSLHERDARGATSNEFRQELCGITPLILALAGDCGWIPGRELGSLLGQDRADAAGEAALFRLDQVADYLQHAPLLGSGTPS